MGVTLNRTEFINQYPPFALLNAANTESVFEKRTAHLYVHLPFCRHKCSYCFFKSFERHDREFVENYLVALKREIDLQSESPHARSRVFKSLYFGGGTPTLLDCNQLEGIIRYVQDKFEFAPDCELCVEANPDSESLTDEKLKLLKDLGTRRISFGVQSFNDDILQLNGRTNTTAVFLEKYAAARKHGFNIINIDLMSGLYGETPENWNSTVDRLLELRPDNAAFYKLEVYYNTDLFKRVRKQCEALPLITNDQEIALIRAAYNRLQDEGNYVPANCFILMSSPDKEHVHRKGVWQGEEMLGLGLSAHSCFNGHLYQNTAAMNEYHRTLDTGRLPIQRAYRYTVEDEISMVMVYGIKSLHIDRSAFKQKFGVDMTDVYGDKIAEMVGHGYVSLDDKALSVNREYYIFADDIAREFFLPRYQNLMLAHHLRN